MPAITNVIATEGAVEVFFSEPMDGPSAGAPANYTLYFITPKGPTFVCPSSASLDGNGTVVTLNGKLILQGWVTVVARNMYSAAGLPIPEDGIQNVCSAKVDGVRKNVSGMIAGAGANLREAIGSATAAINAPTFPVLTEEIGYPPSPLARPGGLPGAVPGGAPLGQVVTQALNSVLGWKVKTDDPKGFIGALNASFACKEVEGHTECTWQPRSYAVQTDLSGGITGAQASLYERAKDALDQSLPLLDGLYALDPTAVAEDVAAYREVVRTQLTQLVNEFGYLGGARASRVNTYFSLLLGGPPTFTPPTATGAGALSTTNSDQIQGSLGALRDLYGIYTFEPSAPSNTRNHFINSVEDEQDTTNFRVIADYVTSLAQSWINNYSLLALTPTGTPFFGTQLVLISRQLSVISEDVDEVRFAMDSVFIGPDERQALLVDFCYPFSPATHTQMFFEDFAKWVQSFVSDEAPQLLQEGGIYAVRFTMKPIVTQLQGLAVGCLDTNNLGANAGLPEGFHTDRVQQSLAQLADDLKALAQLIRNI